MPTTHWRPLLPLRWRHSIASDFLSRPPQWEGNVRVSEKTLPPPKWPLFTFESMRKRASSIKHWTSWVGYFWNDKKREFCWTKFLTQGCFYFWLIKALGKSQWFTFPSLLETFNGPQRNSGQTYFAYQWKVSRNQLIVCGSLKTLFCQCCSNSSRLLFSFTCF